MRASNEAKNRRLVSLEEEMYAAYSSSRLGVTGLRFQADRARRGRGYWKEAGLEYSVLASRVLNKVADEREALSMDAS